MARTSCKHGQVASTHRHTRWHKRRSGCGHRPPAACAMHHGHALLAGPRVAVDRSGWASPHHALGAPARLVGGWGAARREARIRAGAER
eukprot:3229772-Prymnesium_polylepis.1